MQIAIYTRPVAIPHFMIPGVTYSILILIFDEMRKLLVRSGISRKIHPEKGAIMRYDGWVARNTYY